MALKKTAGVIRKHTHPRLQMQFVLFTIIAIVMLGVVIYDVVNQGASLWLIVIGVLVGGIIGYALSWAFKIRWHEDTKRVIQNADRLSFLLIALYIVVRTGGQQLLGHYVHGPMLVALLYSVIAGVMIGRVIALGRRVGRVLKTKKLL